MKSLGKEKTIETQILELQAALHQVASVLKPLPSLSSVLKTSETDVEIIAKFFQTTPEIILKRYKQQKSCVFQCSFCKDGIEVNNLSVEAFFAKFLLDPKRTSIILEGLNVACKLCQQVISLKFLLPLCSIAIASENLISTQTHPPASAASLLCKEADTVSAVDECYQHFLKVNLLDPHVDATKFQNAISFAFALQVCARSLDWSVDFRGEESIQKFLKLKGTRPVKS